MMKLADLITISIGFSILLFGLLHNHIALILLGAALCLLVLYFVTKAE